MVDLGQVDIDLDPFSNGRPRLKFRFTSLNFLSSVNNSKGKLFQVKNKTFNHHYQVNCFLIRLNINRTYYKNKIYLME